MPDTEFLQLCEELAFDIAVQVHFSIIGLIVEPNLSFDVYHQTGIINRKTFKDVMRNRYSFSCVSDLLKT